MKLNENYETLEQLETELDLTSLDADFDHCYATGNLDEFKSYIEELDCDYKAYYLTAQKLYACVIL